MITITVNNREIKAKRGDLLIETLKGADIQVPTLCYMKGLFPTGACRMCVVEVEGHNGLVPSCAFPVSEGMVVHTHSPRVMRARRTIIELLCANHPDDCLYCVRNNNCELQSLSAELGIRARRYTGEKSEYKIDPSNPSIVRDPAKCILCGRCVRVCEEVQTVAAIDFVGRGSNAHVSTAFEQGLNVSSCINCGQCVNVCPTGALREQDSIKDVIAALENPDLFVVAQHAPSVSVTLAEEFGMKPGSDICGAMTGALRTIGFDRVFDTSFSADLTIMEEGSELVQRLTTGGVLPMLTSCSPGWIKFIEQYYPDMLPHLSTCKSPQQMMGAVIKSFFAERESIDPKKIYSVSIMPCTAKKFEAERPEMAVDGKPDIDAVLTTRELARLFRLRGLNPNRIEPSPADTPFGQRSTAGKLFGATGGVMEAALRTAYHLVTGGELDNLEIKSVRNMDGIKETRVKVGDIDLGVAVCSGLGNARKLIEAVKNGRKDLHFIEVMTCPGGCIAGGGQPLGADVEAAKARMKTLYKIDHDETVRTSHSNESIKRLYREYLGEPLSEKSHHLLHTHYTKREVMK